MEREEGDKCLLAACHWLLRTLQGSQDMHVCGIYWNTSSGWYRQVIATGVTWDGTDSQGLPSVSWGCWSQGPVASSQRKLWGHLTFQLRAMQCPQSALSFSGFVCLPHFLQCWTWYMQGVRYHPDLQSAHFRTARLSALTAVSLSPCHTHC